MVAILTGNQLKDPEYTVRYHNGDLWEEFTTQTHVVSHGRQLQCSFANPPLVVDATAEALRRAIEPRLRDAQ